ncbi:plasmid mobilization relaxosome protein MobC [Rubrivirga sp. S365]|uniref:plasmid mobilization protein n=1 Tax=Rubrivirga sp. S365 TaxID=3076080 RepID=UPI0028C8F670|nr:plasmid mobilization relaxosome protein MobC [Rubrivirga sp. S365]MDT7858192.1 plasmid mobilization relaxosome protein MobC [Rubrivirga sp. S365]
MTPPPDRQGLDRQDPTPPGPSPAGGGGRRVGRPKKAPGEGRTRTLYVLLTPDEHGGVKRSAAEAGLSASAYARRRLLGRPVAPLALGRSVDAAQGGLVGAATELNRVGVNLNQLARRANEGGPLGAGPDWAALADEVRAAVAGVRAAAGALGRAADGDGGRAAEGGPVYVRPAGGDGPRPS